MPDRQEYRIEPTLRQPEAGATDLDLGTLLADIGGDESLLRELIDVFIAVYPEMLHDVSQALARDDLQAAARGAHKLVGSVGNFGLGPAFEAARLVEETAKALRSEAAKLAFATAQREFERLADSLQSHVRATTA